MVIQGIEVDYGMEKARIDAHGFDFLKSLKPQCDICGATLAEDEPRTEIDGITIGECCNKES